MDLILRSISQENELEYMNSITSNVMIPPFSDEEVEDPPFFLYTLSENEVPPFFVTLVI